MSENIEVTILSNLVSNEPFFKKVFPFLKKEYFELNSSQVVFELVSDFAAQYEKAPNAEVLNIELQTKNGITQSVFADSQILINSLKPEKSDVEWLVKTSEKWCKQRAIYLALAESIRIHQDEKQEAKDTIPDILSAALAVSFDQHVGHDYIDDSDQRYELYTRQETKLPFDLEYFNQITKGGLPNKTLNVALAGTGVGKSLFMCHLASSTLLQGKCVLYITMEMAEEKIAERIDANLLNININEISQVDKKTFDNKLAKLAKKTRGKLIIKEYPTGAAHSGHFKALLHELALKKNFKPDIIFIDYLNICASSRFKGTNASSYTYIKAIAEELRALAVQNNVPIVTATQTTRAGHGSSDVEITDTSESFGLPATADLMFALISNDQLASLNQMLVKQLKNRYNDPTKQTRFVIGVDRQKMRLYDCEQMSQQDLAEQLPESKLEVETSKDKFQSFKFN